MRKASWIFVGFALVLVAVPASAIDPSIIAKAKQAIEQSAAAAKATDSSSQPAEKRAGVPAKDKAAFTIIGAVVDRSGVEFMSDGTPLSLVLVRSRAGITQDFYIGCIDNLAYYCAGTVPSKRTQVDGAMLSMDGVYDPSEEKDIFSLLMAVKIVGGK